MSNQIKFSNNYYKGMFDKEEYISSGSFGLVYKTTHKTSGKIFAVKKIPFSKNDEEAVLKEANILKLLNDKYVVKCYDIWIEKNNDLDKHKNYGVQSLSNSRIADPRNEYLLHIQMEFCDMTLKYALSNLLKVESFKELSFKNIYILSELFKEIVECINYLHKEVPPIIHRDLKPSNILIILNGSSGRFIKLADFGLAVFHERESQSHSTGVGDQNYMAPEINNYLSTNKIKYGVKADIYSLGLILRDIFKIDLNDNIGFPDDVTKNDLLIKIKESIEDMTKIKANDRPTCEYLLARKFWDSDLNIIDKLNSEELSRYFDFEGFFIQTKLGIKPSIQFEDYIDGYKEKIENVLPSCKDESELIKHDMCIRINIKDQMKHLNPYMNKGEIEIYFAKLEDQINKMFNQTIKCSHIQQMSGISPQRKNRRKRKKKTRNDNSKQIPAHVCLIQNGKTLHCNDSEMIANTPINNEIDPLAADKAIAEEQLNILADSESDEQKCPLVRQLNAENASKYESDLVISTLCKSSTPSLSSSVTTCRNSGRKSRNSLHRTDSKDPEYIRNKTNGNNFSKKVHPSQSLPDLMSTNSDYDSTSMRSIGVHRTGGKRLNKVSRANSFTMPSESQNSTSLCNTAHDRQYSDETQFIEMRDFLRKVNIEYRSEQQADSFHGDSHSLISKSFNNDVASFAELGLTSINSKDTIKTGAAERMFNNNSDYDSTDLNNESLQTYRGIDGAHKAYDENNVLTPYTDQSSDLANFQPMYTSSVKSNSTTRNSRNKQLRSGSTEAVEDKRDVDELVNFINGTDNNVKTHKKKKEKKTNKFEFK